MFCLCLGDRRRAYAGAGKGDVRAGLRRGKEGANIGGLQCALQNSDGMILRRNIP